MRYPQLAQRSLNSRPQQKRNVQISSSKSRKHRPDYTLIVLVSLLLVIGAVVVYAIGPGLTQGTDLGENYYSSKQLTAILLGVVGFGIAALLPIDRWRKFMPLLILTAAIIALLVPFVGDEVNGAHRWIQVGGFSFQAAELVKLALVVWLAFFLSDKKRQQKLQESTTMKVLAGVAVGIGLVVAGMQSDLGSAAVMMAIIGILMYAAGVPFKKLGIALVFLITLLVLAIVVSPYRRDRVVTFFNPTADCQAEGYQACQALITIGSGGFFGKGLGKSVQAYGYLPEPANDSIFAIIAEKFGFVGTVVVVSVFGLLFRRLYKIAVTAPTQEAKLLVLGVLVWLSVQMMINVGAMIGLLPLKGITLPFISYGGTSIIFVMVGMGIVFNISRYTDLHQLNNEVTSSEPEEKINRRKNSLVYRRGVSS